MRSIKNIEKIKETFPGWQPSDVAFIKALEWSRNGILMHCYCQSQRGQREWPDVKGNFLEILLAFRNVSDIKLHFAGQELQQVTGFDILDVSEKGMEGINFEIEEYENGSIGFYCEAVEVMDVTGMVKISM